MDVEAHRRAIDVTLSELMGADSPFVLKGGTSLMKCYGLDRFSEDIDIDAMFHRRAKLEFLPTMECVTNRNGWDLRVAKDTETVQRVFLHYSGDYNSKPLKVELSYRRPEGMFDDVCRRAGMQVYGINTICAMKCSAYASRDRLRDLYDVSFIADRYWDELTRQTREAMFDALEYKGIEQFDYLIRTQDDPLIDKDVLLTRFLNALDMFGLLDDAERPAVKVPRDCRDDR